MKDTWRHRVDRIVNSGYYEDEFGRDRFETRNVCETVAIYKIRPAWLEEVLDTGIPNEGALLAKTKPAAGHEVMFNEVPKNEALEWVRSLQEFTKH